MTDLPVTYLENMKKLLGSDFEKFLSCYEKPALKGLRFNRLKLREDTLHKLISDWNLENVSWCPTGYRYEQIRPGLSPYHDAGLFYMQEPSAMCVVEEAEISCNDLVLDLCAAPGGKSSAAAERCYAILSNEIMPQRAKILSSNIERMGITNCIVSSTSPDRLADCLSGYFDVVITDAPCSGEGMMRKDEVAISEWSPDNVRLCISRQKEILESAAQLVRPGGKLVYSTCTFEPGENEDQISDFISSHPEFNVCTMKRIWPHLSDGEGHFCCVMTNGEPTESPQRTTDKKESILKYMERSLSGSGIHILRSGLVKGEYFTDKKGKKVYEPSHAEIMASSFDTCINGVNLKTEALALSYLTGNVLRPSEDEADFKGEDGFMGVYYDGYPLGLGKVSQGTVKNHLPKGLRRMG